MTRKEQKLASFPTTARMRVFAGPNYRRGQHLGQETMSKEDDIRLDQKVRAAWMYYIAGQNQSEIASQLGTSRPVVQRLIAAAKEEGIVSISLHHPVANCLDYAQLLQEKYRLIECNIVPAFSEESTLDSVSFGCYQLMARYLQDDKEKIIGLGSGLTLKKRCSASTSTA
jgi:DNA-binding transcriptional regulator LsrR (DeoR family)